MRLDSRRKMCVAALLASAIFWLIASCGGGEDPPPVDNTPAWGTAVRISANANAQSPAIAMDGAGNAVVVWSQSDGGRSNIYASRFGGSTWDAAVLLETDETYDAYMPRVAMDGAGRAMAVWKHYDGSLFDICANYFNGSNWVGRSIIEGNEVGTAFSPQIAMDSAGNAIAVWLQNDGITDSIWTNRFDRTNGWRVPVLIEADDTGNAADPRIAMNGTNTAIVVWQRDGGTRDIYSNRFNGTAWGTAGPIETTTYNTYAPQIAADVDGRALAVWLQSDGTRMNLWSRRFDGTAWATASMMAGSSSGHMDDCALAMAFGNDMAVWEFNDGTRYNIYGQVSGGSVALEAGSGDAVQPRVAVDQDSAIAVWRQWDGTRFNIWAIRFDGNGWGTAQMIEANDAGDTYDPQIAMDGSGRAIAVWAQYDGSGVAIWSNRFE